MYDEYWKQLSLIRFDIILQVFTLLQVLETRGNPNHGASFALQHRELFDTEGHIQGRLYFHWALYLFGLGRYDHILRMIQNDMIPSSQTTSYSPQTLRYVTQLYWRLKFADENVTQLHSQLTKAWLSTLNQFTDKEWRLLSPLDRIHCHVSRLYDQTYLILFVRVFAARRATMNTWISLIFIKSILSHWKKSLEWKFSHSASQCLPVILNNMFDLNNDPVCNRRSSAHTIDAGSMPGLWGL